MTASDARPPSDTGATGWHRCLDVRHATIRTDGNCGFIHDTPRPVLVVDLVEAREMQRKAWNAGYAKAVRDNGGPVTSPIADPSNPYSPALGGQEGGQS